MGPRKLPIYRALNKQNLIFGCERELILVVALFCVLLVFVGQTFLTVLAGVFIWTFSVFFLRKMAKRDPHMSKIFVRHIRQQSYYPSRSKPWRKS